MTMPRGTELLIILFIVLLLFGARRLPDLAGSVARSIKEFRRNSDTDPESGAESSEESPQGSDRADGSDGTA